MAIPAWIPEAWAELSPENQKQAGDFLYFLLERQEKEKKARSAFQFGTLKGEIEVSENFDDPLPQFKEYM